MADTIRPTESFKAGLESNTRFFKNLPMFLQELAMDTQRQSVVVDGQTMTRTQIERAQKALALPEFKLGDYVSASVLNFRSIPLDVKGFVIDSQDDSVRKGDVARIIRHEYMKPAGGSVRLVGEDGQSWSIPAERVTLLLRPSDVLKEREAGKQKTVTERQEAVYSFSPNPNCPGCGCLAYYGPRRFPFPE